MRRTLDFVHPAKRIIGIAVLSLSLLLTGVMASPARATGVSTTCTGKTGALTNVTLSVTEEDGTDYKPDGDGYMACVFPNGEAYSIVIGLDDRGDGTASEEMGAANYDRIFTLGFTLPDGESAASAELYARVKSYDIGSNRRDVTIVMQPTHHTSGTDDAEPTPLIDKFADISGGIRVNSAGATRGISGMWIGASADRYLVTLSGSCPEWRSGHTNGSTEAGAIAVRLWAPHVTVAGDLNHGSMKAFIPAATVTACFGVSTVAEVVDALAVTRTEASGTESTLTDGGSGATGFDASEVEGGLLISVPDITFSSPTYKIVKKSSASTGGTSAAPTTAPATPVSASGKRGHGNHATISVTAPNAGGKLVVSEVIKKGKKSLNKVLKKATAVAGTNTFSVKVQGKPKKALIRVTMNGSLVKQFKV